MSCLSQSSVGCIRLLLYWSYEFSGWIWSLHKYFVFLYPLLKCLMLGMQESNDHSIYCAAYKGLRKRLYNPILLLLLSIKDTVDLKTKILLMDTSAEYERLHEELVILQKEMKSLILFCGKCMEITDQDQLHYSIYLSFITFVFFHASLLFPQMSFPIHIYNVNINATCLSLL